MKGTISVWIWIAGGVIAGLLIFTIANSYFARTTRTIAEQRSLEQHNELRTQINELCWSSSENKKQYTVNLDENVLGVYLTKDKYTEYNETQFVDFILNENVSSGNLLCMKMKNKRLICSPIDCSTRMTFLGAVPTEFSLSALINNIIGNPDSFEYRLNFSKFGKEVLVSRAGGKEVLPLCNLDNNCTLKECREDCKDCYGPNPICVGDGLCNSDIDENCLNSIDCACNTSEGYACCLNDPASDNSGCVDETRQNLSKGKKCFCDNECNISANLTCNYLVGDMDNKACCEPGYSWNGSDCIVPFCTYPCTPGCILPDTFDWRNVNGINWLNPVRDQARCGSCWAFSTVGCIEGTYNVEQNCPACNKDLSEQQLVSNTGSCCGSCGDCGGGWPHKALSYAKSTGIVDESCFPYRASTVSCNLCSGYTSRLRKINNYGRATGSMNITKRALICHGPLSVASMNWRHAITLVAYNDITKNWVIRNSWGAGWGSGGYGNIPYSGYIYSDIKNYAYYSEGVNPP